MGRRKRQLATVEKDSSERWLLTYADLITLLMIFFVVMYSMSVVDANKFRAVAESLNKALGGGTPAKMEINEHLSGPSLLQSGEPQNKGQTGQRLDDGKPDTEDNKTKGKEGLGKSEEELSIAAIKAKLDKFTQDNGIQTKITSTVHERGLVISIQETILFDSGSAEVTPYAKQILQKISVVLSPVSNFIRIEGHTDNLPINTPKFRSNWELSVLRATNVLHILKEEGKISPYRLSADGYGEYRPVASNATEEGKARNRRVDLVILRSKYDLTEPGSQKE